MLSDFSVFYIDYLGLGVTILFKNVVEKLHAGVWDKWKSGLFQFLGFQGTMYCSCTIWVVKRNSKRKGGKLWKLKHFIRPWVKNYSLCCECKQLSHLSQMTKNIILYLVRPWYFLSEYSLKKYLITIKKPSEEVFLLFFLQRFYCLY